ncbi:biopolymer transporter ExbD [Parvularcula sp. IMCC14364]|uniref:ExbD/TolR family protein n=1 Tax=Parvularcula sp. IMCC14364 TaxID=3067902 RepID=UPI002740CEDF|nr:biopolymer transporter ExbD [Parvularcula sp. IMCC14364]
MARRQISNAAADDEDVNVTPLLDIVFIMLIFFIVTSTFIKETGTDVLRPDAQTADKIKLISLLVAVNENDEIWINKELVSLDEVEFKVRELRRETPKGSAVVQVDQKARSELMIDVIQKIKDADVDVINIATLEE